LRSRKNRRKIVETDNFKWTNNKRRNSKDRFKISRQAAHKEIIKLIELNLIEQKGAVMAIT